MTRKLECAVAVASIAFVLLAAGYEHDPLATIDREVAEWVARDMPVWAEWLARPFSWFGGWIGMLPLSVGLVAVLLAAGRMREAIWAAATLAGIHLVITPVQKELFDRPRPDQGSPIPLPSSDAFPSGHASGSVVTFALVAMFGAERWPRRGRLLWALAIVLALGAGVSRVVLNVHFVTDVLAGFALGLAWLAGCLLVREIVASRHGGLVAQSHKAP